MALVIGVSSLMGYTSEAAPAEWLIAIVILLCFAVALSSFAVIAGAYRLKPGRGECARYADDVPAVFYGGVGAD
jgi:hypothetical protein